MPLSVYAEEFTPSFTMKPIQEPLDVTAVNQSQSPGLKPCLIEELSETIVAVTIDRRKPTLKVAASRHMAGTTSVITSRTPSTANHQVPYTGKKRPTQTDGLNVIKTRSGRKKMIIRPCDSNKKVSKLKKSVLEFRGSEDSKNEESSLAAALVSDASAADETTALTSDELRPYERLKQKTDKAAFVEMEQLAVQMLSGLKMFQDRMHQRNKIKARTNQRMYYGLREALKYVTSSKIRMLLLARDLEPGPGVAGLDQLVDELLDKARSSHIPVVCVLTRKKLQNLTHKPSKVACVAIANFAGREQEFEALKELAAQVNPFTALETENPKIKENEQARDAGTLKTWISTIRCGRYELPVDKLF
ncbi:hypothetical protein BIW11_10997 [Tropilaelaps mercedesae]|uniref:Ribosomal protein L7Ae/L30e/S12e/Gadd45 domain-containing protein n=1 Tax=Tropilaelaps mercedesae TaxID=418985 RepID=A0A1V9XD11_9ACAR|nr:hypothetical protein BIW11_10997 [Tropilaelaps mercedesae]